MTEPGKTAPVDDEPGVRSYTLLCLGSLSLLLLVLLRKDAGPWSFIPVAIGLFGVWQHWRLGPYLTLISLVIVLVSHEPVGDIASRSSPSARTFRLPDWMLCMAALGYVIGQYRLLSLTHSILPADPRRRKAPLAENTSRPSSNQCKTYRDPRQAQPAELGTVLMALPICALFAQVLWKLLPMTTSWSGHFSDARRALVPGIVVAWLFALALFVAHGLLRYLSWQQQAAQAARLTVLDTCWQETSREQRRISHWLAWARLRRKPRKEPS